MSSLDVHDIAMPNVSRKFTHEANLSYDSKI